MLQQTKAQELNSRLYELIALESSALDRMLKIRQIMEQLYKALTEDARISFNGLFARMQYVHQTDGLSPELQTQSNQLRLLCNKIAHEEVTELAPGTIDTAIMVVSSLIQLFCPDSTHPNLVEYLAHANAKPFIPANDSNKQSFLCVVNSWQVMSTGQGEKGIEIEAIREDGKTCSILLRDDLHAQGSDGRQYSKLGNSLWKYASLHCHGLSEVAGKENFFQSTPQSIIVLEPDFLIDASALAECFSSSSGNPEFFILNRLFHDAYSEAMLQGSVVNNVFDELVLSPNQDYLDMFKSSLAALPIAMVSLGKEAAFRIYERVRDEHLAQLKEHISRLGNAEILLEPSYICPEYGLQGRLDLLARTDARYSIVELKSGKAHPYDVWLGHQMQVIAYNMIIRSAYGARRISNASILYSVNKEKPLRHVVNISILEQNLLMCRNRILGIMHLLTENPATFFNWLLACTDMPDNPIMKAKLERFKTLIATIGDYEYEWFLAQVQRIVREIWFVKTGDNGNRSESSFGHNALWQQGRAEKIAGYKIITDLIPISYDKKLIDFAIPSTDDITDFREGDIVVLYCQNARITNQEILRGIITILDEKHLQISIRGGLKNNQRFSAQSAWAIEHDTLETSLYSPLSSLIHFLRADPHLRKLIMGLEAPQSEQDTSPTDPHSMETIIARMHAAKDLFIVQGPPGTGKTSGLLGTYIHELYTQSDKQILILSFTNRAVDEICLCLLRKEIPFLRMGNSAVIKDQLLNTQIADKRFEEMETVISNNRIWVATVQSANAWYQDLLKITKIDELIIDEASQIIENSILGIIAQAPKTVLIGDQNQLPPISVQSSLNYQFTHPLLQNLCYGSYHQSLMERLHRVQSLCQGQNSLAMLRLHYRMHEQIAQLISHYYQDHLQAALGCQTTDLTANASLPEFLNNRLVWISCPASKTSNYDILQVQLTVAIITLLLDSGEVNSTANGIGIVAPFRAMIHALRKEIPPQAAGITIDTVERFQGSERDSIILCLPLRHETNLRQVESLSDDGLIDRKLNVALSRARQRIIILGNEDLCRSSRHYAQLINCISAKGVFIDSALAFKQLTS
ncbi:MAG: AAA domain-containing protein [Candidatus Cloacimonas sp.]|jgi:hypothetical protein|nr:AAA domain-containing protein [Candidatus Cloacimonas sp.]